MEQIPQTSTASIGAARVKYLVIFTASILAAQFASAGDVKLERDCETCGQTISVTLRKAEPILVKRKQPILVKRKEPILVKRKEPQSIQRTKIQREGK